MPIDLLQHSDKGSSEAEPEGTEQLYSAQDVRVDLLPRLGRIIRGDIDKRKDTEFGSARHSTTALRSGATQR